MKHKIFYKINTEYIIKNRKTNKEEIKRTQLNIIATNKQEAMNLAYEIIKNKNNICNFIGCAFVGTGIIYI